MTRCIVSFVFLPLFLFWCFCFGNNDEWDVTIFVSLIRLVDCKGTVVICQPTENGLVTSLYSLRYSDGICVFPIQNLVILRNLLCIRLGEECPVLSLGHSVIVSVLRSN